MSFGILDILSGAASLATGLATANPLVGAGVGAALSGGRTALQGGTPEQIAMSAGTSGAMSGLTAGAGALGGAAGEAVGGQVGQAIGNKVAPMVMNAGIGALRGKTPEQLAEEAAQSGIMSGAQYGIRQFAASGGAVTPALYASRSGYADGGGVGGGNENEGFGGGDVGFGGAGGSGNGDMGGGGWGDAPTDGGGYMGSSGLDGGYSDSGVGGNGAGIIDIGSAPLAPTTPEAPVEVAPGVAPAPPPVYAPAPSAYAVRKPLLDPSMGVGFQNFQPAANPFGRPPVTAFAAGGRVGMDVGGEVPWVDWADDTGSPAILPPTAAAPPPAAPEPDWWDRNKKWAGPVGVVGGLTALGTLGNMLSGSKKKAAPAKTREQLQAEYPMRPYTGGAPVAAPVGYVPGVSPEWNYFPTRGYAGGGGISSLPGGKGADAMVNKEERGFQGRRVMEAAEAALNNQHPEPQTAIGRFREHFGDDALATLMEKARRGDGMSDSLPATIDGKDSAALASGEYVIPADVVSHLGNGSSQAGSRELDLMSARIRKARTGSAKQAPGVKVGGYLPS